MKNRSHRLKLIVAAAVCTGALCLGAAAQTPKVGDKAPLIEGKDQDGKAWKLADEVGKKVVLLYFPKMIRRAAPKKPAVFATASRISRKTTSKLSV